MPSVLREREQKHTHFSIEKSTQIPNRKQQQKRSTKVEEAKTNREKNNFNTPTQNFPFLSARLSVSKPKSCVGVFSTVKQYINSILETKKW